MKKCCIFSGGELENADFVAVNDTDYVICADSGLKHALRLGITPDLVIGDFDSYSGKLPESAECIKCRPEKDDTDTLMAVKQAIARGCDEIVIYGAFGGRFDHTIANVQTLRYAMVNGVHAYLEDSRNKVYILSEGVYELSDEKKKYLSVFAYGGELKIKKLSGVKYPLENAVLNTDFPLGVSNEIICDRAVIEIDKGTALIICSE